MFALRCTRKLLKRIEPSAFRATEPPASSTRLGDWTANRVIIRRQQLVLAVSNVTLLPALLPIGPSDTLLARLPIAVRAVLLSLGIEPQKVDLEMDAMGEGFVTTTNSRQVLGTMNEFTFMLESYLDARTMVDVAVHLAETPCKPLRWESPRSATMALFTQVGSGSKQSPRPVNG